MTDLGQFKVGDEVIVHRRARWCDFKVIKGEQARVVCVHPTHGYIGVEFHKYMGGHDCVIGARHGYGALFEDDDFEKVEKENTKITFKIGDKVGVKQSAWQVNARGKMGTVGVVCANGDVGVYFSDSIKGKGINEDACSIAGSPNDNGCYLSSSNLELVSEKETKMKIGQYEVEVISKDEVKVGCRTFSRGNVEELLKWFRNRPALVPREVPSTLVESQVVTGDDIQRVLDLMDNFTERLVPSKLRANTLAIGVNGKFAGSLFVRGGADEVTRISGLGFVGHTANHEFYDNTTVRILTDEEIKRMLAAVKP